jgi:RecA/RadA recombinase
MSYHGDAQGLLTTGDTTLNRVLGGGIRTGMVWEFVGERCVLIPYLLQGM